MGVQPDDMYSEELTPEEAKLGFIKAYVRNPKQGFYGSGSIIPAVIYRCPNGERLIKMNNPVTGTASYARQAFGTYGVGGSPDWTPVGTSWPDPATAIETSGIEPEVQYTPETPTISLRCPECNHEFELEADHLPFDGHSKCPECGHSDSTESFNALNV